MSMLHGWKLQVSLTWVTCSAGAVRPKPYAADAHDARLLVRQMAPITRAVRFANVRGFGGRAAKTIRS